MEQTLQDKGVAERAVADLQSQVTELQRQLAADRRKITNMEAQVSANAVCSCHHRVCPKHGVRTSHTDTCLAAKMTLGYSCDLLRHCVLFCTLHVWQA